MNTHFIYSEYLNVIDYFNKNIENQASTISKNLNIKKTQIDYYIDLYLSLKKNYNGDIIDPPTSKIKYKSKIGQLKCRGVEGITVDIYENDEFIDRFKSIKNACEFLNVNEGSVNRMFKGGNEVTINHYSIKRKITYKKVVRN